MHFTDFEMLRTNKFILDKSSNKPLIFIKQYIQIERKKSFKFIKPKKKQLIIPSKLKQVNFEELLLFYTVINSGSINLASERLRLSQPAISLSLQKVEQQLGCLLFKKSNSIKSLSLSIYGSVLYNYVERIFELFNEIIQFNSNFLSNHLTLSENIIQLNIDQNQPLLLNIKPVDNNRARFLTLERYFQFPIRIDSLRLKLLHFKIISTDFVEINTLNALEISKSMKISPIFCWRTFR